MQDVVNIKSDSIRLRFTKCLDEKWIYNQHGSTHEHHRRFIDA